jgi:hypothetical protein
MAFQNELQHNQFIRWDFHTNSYLLSSQNFLIPEYLIEKWLCAMLSLCYRPINVTFVFSDTIIKL